MDTRWYKKSRYRNLVDMHIANGDARLLAHFDPDIYADNMKSAGFDTAYIYASNCLGLCLYPSKVGYLHQISTTRDIFGETVSACSARGIRPIGYLNSWSTAAYDAHPDWRVVNAEGKGYRDHPGHAGRYGVLCPNSPYRDYFLSLVEEVVSGYPIAGLWVDMVGFWRGACYCTYCRDKFKQETGEDIPDRISAASPIWQKYLRFKTDSIYRYACDIAETARKLRPNISVSLQSAGFALGHFLGFDERYFSAFDYAAGDFYTDVADASFDCKFLSAMTREQPFEYMVSRCPTLTYHTVSKPEAMLVRQGYSAILHGGAFLAIDAIDPEGTMNAEIYRLLGRVKNALTPFYEHPSYLAGKPYAKIGVYFNYDSAFDPLWDGTKAGDFSASAPIFTRLKSIDRALAKRHFLYDIVTKLDLDSLSQYSLLILSELYTLTAEEKEAIRAYTEGGGKLYVSGRCGTYDALSDARGKETLLREDFALGNVMGVSLAGTLPYDSCYLAGTENTALSALHTPYPLGTKAKGAPRVTAMSDTQVLACATLPFSDHTDGKHYLSAISDPPWEKTDIPVLTMHSYGKGVCLYSALLLEADKNDETRALWLSLIQTLLSDTEQIEIQAPACLEISARRAADRLSFFLLNTLREQTEAPAGKTEIKIPHALLRVHTVECFPEGNVTCDLQEDHTVVRAEGLPEFAVLTLS